VKPTWKSEDGRVQLYLADCLEVLPHLSGIDACITDPPYGIGCVHSGGGKGKHTRRNAGTIFGNDVPFDPTPWLAFSTVLMFGADHYANRLPEGRWLVWDKLSNVPQFDNFSDVEMAWQNRKGASRIFHYLWKGICQAGDKAGGKLHVSQKPVPLMLWCLDQARVPEGATVFDPFMGSGTTGIA
jgi:site-specific DNA-methyltransferase (adenine-specific)